VGRSPYSLHDADASRFKAVGELNLLEDHLINDPCPDCMNKHAMTASRFMSEAASLNGGEPGDVIGSELIESARQCIHPESDIPLARRVRDIRKVIQKKLNLSHAHGANDTHAHEDAAATATPSNDNHGPGAHVHDDGRAPALVAGRLVAGRYGFGGGHVVVTGARSWGPTNPVIAPVVIAGAIVGYWFGGLLFVPIGAVLAFAAGLAPVFAGGQSAFARAGDWYVNRGGVKTS
jgi:hypothetical protein